MWAQPEDVWMALEKDRENLFFIDVQARGAYPVWAARVFREKGVTIAKEAGDNEILRHTVDFVSFSYYASRCASAEMNAGNTSAANIVKSLKNPHIQASEWGWGIDPLGLRANTATAKAAMPIIGFGKPKSAACGSAITEPQLSTGLKLQDGT